MKSKFFFFMIFFLGFGFAALAQNSTDVSADKKDATAPVVTADQSKTAECPHHQTTGMKAECKWTDADNDGKCDKCGMTAAECKEKCKSETMTSKGCDPAACAGHKEQGKKSEDCPNKDGKKNE